MSGVSGKIRAQAAQRVRVHEPPPRADGGCPRHEHLAAGAQQPLRHAQILGAIRQDLEAIAAQDFRRFDEAENVRLKRVVVRDDLELHPVRLEDLARHLRRGDGFLWRVAPGGIGQNACAEAFHHVPEPGARARVAAALAAQRNGQDACARSLDRTSHDVWGGIQGRAEQKPRLNRLAI